MPTALTRPARRSLFTEVTDIRPGKRSRGHSSPTTSL
jgi:hypothetical protein